MWWRWRHGECTCRSVIRCLIRRILPLHAERTTHAPASQPRDRDRASAQVERSEEMAGATFLSAPALLGLPSVSSPARRHAHVSLLPDSDCESPLMRANRNVSGFLPADSGVLPGQIRGLRGLRRGPAAPQKGSHRRLLRRRRWLGMFHSSTVYAVMCSFPPEHDAVLLHPRAAAKQM